ncbi:MAG: hypothetical protein JNL81_17265 [Hyphomonadaceae bacterium]|nr:hypothetical protein [Hyphomonadaceae bacterium]
MSSGRQYEQIVSLGRGCQPAHQIRRLNPGATAHMFDWIVTPDAALISFIAADLEGFFVRERLEMGPENCIIDRATKTQFLHEFPAGCSFDAQFANNADKYAMLARRWRELLASEQTILFVRQHAWDEDLRASATRLRDTIAAKAPRLRFSLLYLTATDEPDWGEAGIINRRLTQPNPYVWTGDDLAWETLLNEACALPPQGNSAQ